MATMVHTLTPELRRQRGDHLQGQRDGNTDLEISDMGFALAQHFISYYLRTKLKHSDLKGLPKNYLIPPSSPSELAQLISKVGLEVEHKYATYFTGMADSLALSEDNARSAFMSVARQAFADRKYNWGRIISVFMLAGTFALFFTKRGHFNTTTAIAGWFQIFVEEDLTEWIKMQGGWDDLVKQYSSKRQPTLWPQMLAFGGLCAAAGYMLIGGTR